MRLFMLYFRLKDENLYFLNNACEPLKDKKKATIL